MKAILSTVIAIFVAAPSLFADSKAGETKACDQAKACCAEKAKASECCSTAKKTCPVAQRKALLTHKGAWVVQR